MWGLSFLGVLAFLFMGQSKVFAAPVDDTDFANARYVVTAMECSSPATVKVNIGGTDYSFLDKNPCDNGENKRNLKYYGQGFICNQDGGGAKMGITITGNRQPVPGGGALYPAQITLNYSDNTNKNCDEGNADEFLPPTDIALLHDVPSPAPEPTPATPAARTGDETTDCITNGDTGLEWIACPVITALSKASDKMNDLVSDQLNFNVGDNLANGSGVHRAWSLIKNIATAMLVIIMLVMVFSQAVSWGPFDAYTVKKVLPRLVIAAIAMQISWQLCRWLIGLANDAGEGVGDLLTAPFGGTGNLDLPSLLNRLSGWWAAGTQLTLYGVLVTSVLLAWVYIPGILLIAFTVFVSILIALATVLLRNALIIACVIFVPVALLVWILPGPTTQKWWKMWSDNFTKLLLLFPLMMALIYSGRIFAWIVGDIGEPGFLDFIMVLVGFFGPYFFLPKAFKWGGTGLAMASKAINENKGVAKTRELGNKELRDWQQRRSRLYGKNNLNPFDKDYVKAKKWKGIPYGWSGKLGKTAMTNVKAGRLLPTRRALGVAIHGQNETAKQEDAFEEVIASRGREKATSRQRNIMAGKNQSVDMVVQGLQMIANGEAESGKRRGKAGIRDLIASRSFYELAKIEITDPTDGKKKFVWQTDLWRDTVAPDGELYRIVGAERPDWTPHRLPTGLPKYRGEGVLDDNDQLLPEYITDRTSKLEERNRRNAAVGKPLLDIPTELEKERRKAVLLKHNPDDLQYAEALSEVVGEMDARKLSSISPVMFERVGDTAEQGVIMARQAQEAEARGDAQTAADLRVKSEMMLKPAKLMRGFFAQLARTGQAYQISNVMGAVDAEEMVDHAIEYIPDPVTGQPTTLEQLIHLESSRGRAIGETGGGSASGGGQGGGGDQGGGNQGGGGQGGSGGQSGGGNQPPNPQGVVNVRPGQTINPTQAQGATANAPEFVVRLHQDDINAIGEAAAYHSNRGTRRIFQEESRKNATSTTPPAPSENESQPPQPPTPPA